MSTRSPLKIDGPCEYRPAGPGLQRWRPAIVRGFELDNLVTITPTAGDRAPLLIPRAPSPDARAASTTVAGAACGPGATGTGRSSGRKGATMANHTAQTIPLPALTIPAGSTWDEAQRLIFRAAVRANNNNHAAAARALGCNRSTIARRLASTGGASCR